MENEDSLAQKLWIYDIFLQSLIRIPAHVMVFISRFINITVSVLKSEGNNL